MAHFGHHEAIKSLCEEEYQTNVNLQSTKPSQPSAQSEGSESAEDDSEQSSVVLTPLHVAGSAAAVKALLECKSLSDKGARWEVDERLGADQGRITPMYLAAQRGNTEVVEAFQRSFVHTALEPQFLSLGAEFGSRAAPSALSCTQEFSSVIWKVDEAVVQVDGWPPVRVVVPKETLCSKESAEEVAVGQRLHSGERSLVVVRDEEGELG